MNLWPHQLFALEELPRLILAGFTRICLTAPTGAGKSAIICGLIEWGIENGFEVILYTNRKLLIEQLSRVLAKHGIEFGVRAAGHEDNRHLPVQISSLPTERARVLKSERWQEHGRGKKVLAIVDEAHLNKSETAQAMLDKHDGPKVGFTATPIGLGHMYDKLLVAGTPSELRKCGALVAAYHYGPDEPDMARFKTNIKTGEYSEADVRKAIMTKCIFARVLDWYAKLNDDRRPTILFGPGVKESIWFAEQLSAKGISAAHIDGNGIWVDGEYERAGMDARQQILSDVRSGRIKVLCNRFVAREGLDLPEVSHLILATVMGSLQTYLQSAGRGLRACEGKDRLVIQDHGGHWHRHGSVNLDRQWQLTMTENVLHGLREEGLREKREPEPIHCQQCGLIRISGPICPQCGHEGKIRSRMVIQTNGILKEHTGDIYRPRKVQLWNNTEKMWTNAYYRAKNSKNGMTFRQAEGLFFYENHHWPPRNLPLMPADPMDWFARVRDVPYDRLIPIKDGAA